MMTIDEQNEGATLTKTHKRTNQSMKLPVVVIHFWSLKTHNTTKHWRTKIVPESLETLFITITEKTHNFRFF